MHSQPPLFSRGGRRHCHGSELSSQPSCRFTWKEAGAGVNLSTTAPIVVPQPFHTRSKRRDRTNRIVYYFSCFLGRPCQLMHSRCSHEAAMKLRYATRQRAKRGLKTPELVIVDGAPGLEKALAALWSG